MRKERFYVFLTFTLCFSLSHSLFLVLKSVVVYMISHQPSPISHQPESVSFRGNKLIALAVDVDDFNLVVVLQVLAQLRDIHVHRTGVEVVVVYPDGLQGKVALEDFVGVRAEQRQQFVLLRRQLGLFLTDGK